MLPTTVLTYAPLQTLLSIYSDLLDFYFAAIKLLESRYFGIDLAVSAIKSSLVDPITSATKNIDALMRLIDAETLAMVNLVKENQLDDLSMECLHESGTHADR
jgi:hypothetical protein